MSHSHSEPPCSSLTNLSGTNTQKLFQAFIISVPISSAFFILFFFYLCYLRRQRADWASLRMRAFYSNNNDISRSELGLKKELREMLPIIIYKESFSIRDTQCSVCLGDYQAEDRLQQIPACGHTFHMDCIDHWLTTHNTCPLCRLSLLPSAKSQSEPPHIHVETSHESSVAMNSNETSIRQTPHAYGETEAIQFSESRQGDGRIPHNNASEEAKNSGCIDHEREYRDTRNDDECHEHTDELSA